MNFVDIGMAGWMAILMNGTLLDVTELDVTAHRQCYG